MIHSKNPHNKYFENHSTIPNIKGKGFDASFTFRDISFSEVINIIKAQKVKKASKVNTEFSGN